MKKSNSNDLIVHYIPEFYNNNKNSRTGQEYGWIQAEEFKKPYTSKKWALAALDRNIFKSRKKRLRIETFKCTNVQFEEVK